MECYSSLKVIIVEFIACEVETKIGTKIKDYSGFFLQSFTGGNILCLCSAKINLSLKHDIAMPR